MKNLATKTKTVFTNSNCQRNTRNKNTPSQNIIIIPVCLSSTSSLHETWSELKPIWNHTSVKLIKWNFKPVKYPCKHFTSDRNTILTSPLAGTLQTHKNSTLHMLPPQLNSSRAEASFEHLFTAVWNFSLRRFHFLM